MAFLILVYGETVFKQFWLPKEKNQSYTAVLYKDYFRLSRTTYLKLRNIDGQWYFNDKKMQTGKQYEVTVEKEEKLTVRFIRKAEYSFYKKYFLKDKFYIGRGKDNDLITCCSEAVSRRHAVIIRTENGWSIRNSSINGVYINGIFVKEQRKLDYGDIIYIPGMYMIFLGNYIAAEMQESGCSGDDINFGELQEISCPPTVGAKEYVTSPGIFHRAPRFMEEIEKSPIEIDTPPDIKEREKESVFMKFGAILNMMLPMLIMNLFMIYAMKAEHQEVGIYIYAGLVMAGVSILFSVLWMFMTDYYEKKTSQKEIKKRVEEYKKYLEEKSSVIEDRYQETRKILNSRYIYAGDYLYSEAGYTDLWNRNPYHEDFLKFRMGTGDKEFQTEIIIPQERFEISKNRLWKQAEKIKEHYRILYQVPVLLDLKKYGQIGITGSTAEEITFIVRNLVSQIILSNCYTEVKLVFVYNEKTVTEEGEWDFCRWLPHVWAADRKYRFVANSKESARRLFYQLMKIFKERKEGNRDTGNNVLPHYIIFISEPDYLEGEMITKYIFDSAFQYGVTVIWTEKEREKLPNLCNIILENNRFFSGWYDTNQKSKDRLEVKFDYIEKKQLEWLARKISPVRVAEIEENRDVPDLVDFFSLYDARYPEDLNIEERWQKNKVFESMKAEIGKKSGGKLCCLDIHEKYHGPHGLLAGTTGSGKSEVLQTYILSLAVNFSPEYVNFFLIDYKGEGMSGLFSDLPHVCGRISNLSGGLAYRAMISVKSENKRRQKIFKNNKVNNINEYNRQFYEGIVKEALPHLLIIIDEFAELKKEQPEFMEELISVAQVGRSLGVHLILATQKPGGIVDDKIWSNSRFHICLKVQERQDSMEMLHNMDACNISQTGRGYLQVGNNEVYELFQAGWSGAKFEEKEEESSIVQMITIDGMEDREGIVKEQEAEEETRSQLEVVKEYIKQLVLKKKIQKGKMLWLEPLPQKLYLAEVMEKFRSKLSGEGRQDRRDKKEGERNRVESTCYAFVGLFDNPSEQEQPVFALDLYRSGHIFVCGEGNSGKSIFLQTMLFSLTEENSPENVHLYLLDYSGGLLSGYAALPHVGDVIAGKDEEKVRRLFLKLETELQERKELLKGGNLWQYKQSGKGDLPLLVIVIDSFIEFYENGGYQYESIVGLLLREGEKAGISFIVTSSSFSIPGVSPGIKDYFKTKVCFSMRDTYSYGEVFGMINVPVLPEKGILGRGIACYNQKILEFQGALAVKAESDYSRLDMIKKIMEKRSRNWKGCKAEKIKTIPKKIKWDTFLNKIEETIKADQNAGRVYLETDKELKIKETERIYIGYDDRNAEIFGIPLDKIYCFLVMGNSQKRINSFMELLTASPKKEEVGVYIIDFEKKLRIFNEQCVCIENEEDLFAFFESLAPVFSKRSQERKNKGTMSERTGKKERYFIIIMDMVRFLKVVYEGTFEMKGYLENVWEKGSECGIYFWADVNCNNTALLKEYPAFRLFCSYGKGILLDGNLIENPIVTFDGLSYEKQSENLKDREAFYLDGKNNPVKLVIPEVTDDIY